jgi:hypothetical protein
MADYPPSQAVPSQDVDMLGEYPPPFLPPPFQGIAGLLPPKQTAPENNSGEFRVQYSFRTTIVHHRSIMQNIILTFPKNTIFFLNVILFHTFILI